jgi:hypothetical protein
MSGWKYTVLAYVVGLGLLIGYAVVLWVESRNAAAKGKDGRAS